MLVLLAFDIDPNICRAASSTTKEGAKTASCIGLGVGRCVFGTSMAAPVILIPYGVPQYRTSGDCFLFYELGGTHSFISDRIHRRQS